MPHPSHTLLGALTRHYPHFEVFLLGGDGGDGKIKKISPPDHLYHTLETYLDIMPSIQRHNADGWGVHWRFAGAGAPCCVIDDVSPLGLAEMRREGYTPSAVVETSPDNYQVWIRWADGLVRPEVALAVSRLCNHRWGDPGAVGARHAGRLPGYLSHKHNGYRVALIECTGAMVEPHVREYLLSLWADRGYPNPSEVDPTNRPHIKDYMDKRVARSFPGKIKKNEEKKKIISSGAGLATPEIDIAAYRKKLSYKGLKPDQVTVDWSVVDWHVVAALYEEGYTTAEIATQYRADVSEHNHTERKPQHPEDYLQRTLAAVRRIRSYPEPDEMGGDFALPDSEGR